MSAHIASDERLAIDGGDPVRATPLPPWPYYGQAERDAASNVLASGKVNYWTGNHCRDFEAEFAAYHGGGHAISLANGTLALELALRVLGIGEGDEVIVTPRSYFASASCCAIVGAIPVFAEVDANSQNITADSIAAAITPKTKAIIVVHLAGWPCEMPEIMSLASERGLLVIEDCAQAHGARIDDRLVGTFGDMAAWSFCQDKIMSTAGEGGMLMTHDPALWEAAWSFKDHGKSWQRVRADDHPPGFRWLHEGFGSNYRLTELQAAIGRLQLGYLDEWIAKRRDNAERLNQGIMAIPALRTTLPSAREYHSYYKFYAFVRPSRLRDGWSRDRILRALEAEGLPGLSGSCPEIYRERAFEHESHAALSIAHELGETSLMLPVHPTLGVNDIDDMIIALKKIFKSV
jgi:dTDP-4-amino-4,6-dideoxygalactose transaminase